MNLSNSLNFYVEHVLFSKDCKKCSTCFKQIILGVTPTGNLLIAEVGERQGRRESCRHRYRYIQKCIDVIIYVDYANRYIVKINH